MDKKIVYCLGAKWFDKTNGNTYNNVKVIDGDNIEYLGYEYGYGDYYWYRAKAYFEEKYGPCNYNLINLGCFYIKKNDLKNENF